MFKFTGQSVPASTTVVLNPPAGKTWVMGQPFNTSTNYRYTFERIEFSDTSGTQMQVKLPGLALNSTGEVRLQNTVAEARWMAIYYYELDNPADDIVTYGLYTSAGVSYDYRPAAGTSWLVNSVKFADLNLMQTVRFKSGATTYEGTNPHSAVDGYRLKTQLLLTNAVYLVITGHSSLASYIVLSRVVNPDATQLWQSGSLAGGATVRLTPAAGKAWLVGALCWSSLVQYWLYRISGTQRLHYDGQTNTWWWFNRFWLPETVGLELYNTSGSAMAYALNGLIENN